MYICVRLYKRVSIANCYQKEEGREVSSQKSLCSSSPFLLHGSLSETCLHFSNSFSIRKDLNTTGAPFTVSVLFTVFISYNEKEDKKLQNFAFEISTNCFRLKHLIRKRMLQIFISVIKYLNKMTSCNSVEKASRQNFCQEFWNDKYKVKSRDCFVNTVYFDTYSNLINNITPLFWVY